MTVSAALTAPGRMFRTGSGLVERLALDAPLDEADPIAFSGDTEKGRTDYSLLVARVERLFAQAPLFILYCI